MLVLVIASVKLVATAKAPKLLLLATAHSVSMRTIFVRVTTRRRASPFDCCSPSVVPKRAYLYAFCFLTPV